MVNTTWRNIEDVFHATISRLVKTPSRRLVKWEIVKLSYDKNRQSFCGLLRSWLCSTTLNYQKTRMNNYSLSLKQDIDLKKAFSNKRNNNNNSNSNNNNVNNNFEDA